MTYINVVKIALSIAMGLGMLSCVKAPVEIAIPKEIEITEQKVNDISDKILKEIMDIEVTKFGEKDPAYVDPEECKKAFNQWITERFSEDKVPKRVVTPLEYATSSTDPKKSQCRNVDVEKEFVEANRRQQKDNKQTIETELMDLKEYREAFNEGECAKRYIAPLDDPKIAITGMRLVVKTNTLNMNAPTYKIYYTDPELEQADLEGDDKEQSLKKEGKISLFATSRKFAPGFTGTIEMDMISNEDELKKGQRKVGTFDAKLLPVPAVLSSELETKQIGDETFYVIPRGMVSMSLEVDISVKAEIGDAVCALKEFKKKAKERDDEKKENYTPDGG